MDSRVGSGGSAPNKPLINAISRKLFCVIFEGFLALEMSGKGGLFKELGMKFVFFSKTTISE